MSNLLTAKFTAVPERRKEDMRQFVINWANHSFRKPIDILNRALDILTARDRPIAIQRAKSMNQEDILSVALSYSINGIRTKIPLTKEDAELLKEAVSQIASSPCAKEVVASQLLDLLKSAPRAVQKSLL